MVLARPFLLVVADDVGQRVPADGVAVTQLPVRERGAVDDGEVERHDHVHALGLKDFSALHGHHVDLHGLGLVHGAQLRERIGVLVDDGNAGLFCERLAERGHGGFLPGAAEHEGGDRKLGRRRCRMLASRKHGEGGRPRESATQRLDELAPIRSAGLQQDRAQARANVVDIHLLRLIPVALMDHLPVPMPCAVSPGIASLPRSQR